MEEFSVAIEDLDLFTDDGFWFGMAHTAMMYGYAHKNGWDLDRFEIIGQPLPLESPERKVVMVIHKEEPKAQYIMKHWGKYVQEHVDEDARAVFENA